MSVFEVETGHSRVVAGSGSAGNEVTLGSEVAVTGREIEAASYQRHG